MLTRNLVGLTPSPRGQYHVVRIPIFTEDKANTKVVEERQIAHLTLGSPYACTSGSPGIYRRTLGTDLTWNNLNVVTIRHSWRGKPTTSKSVVLHPAKVWMSKQQDVLYGDPFMNMCFFFDWKQGKMYINKATEFCGLLL